MSEKTSMKLLIALSFAVVATADTATPQALLDQSSANPVVASAREIFDREAKFIVAAAEEMPADKYGFQPTKRQWTYGKTIAHIVEGKSHVCAMLGTLPATSVPAVKETDSKEALGTALKASFDYCAKTLDTLQDPQLGNTVTFFGGGKTPRARALLELAIDVADHYSQMAGMLRLNNLEPPSAKK
jgi:uncharacterized damage-inducible protein DinB